ncbi:MAG: ABC transporter ATP-binding protein [Dehalococcoidia bacterium]|nr:ABC transporter ATP-binding protein [Dehalococcoidia bacterium]
MARMGGWGGMHGAGGMGMGGPWHRAADGWSDDDLGKAYDHKVVVRLMGYLRPYNVRVILALIGTILFSLTSYTQPALIGWATDRAMEGNLHSLAIIGVAMVGLAAAAWASYYMYMTATSWMGHRVLYTLRHEMFTHLQKLSLSFYDHNEVGRVMSRVQNDVTALQELVTSGFFTILADILGLSVVVFWLLKLDMVLALATMAVVPLLLLVLWIWQQRAKRAFIGVRQTIAVVNSNLQENISGVRVIQGLNREDENLRKFDKVNAANLKASIHVGQLTAVIAPAVEICVALATGAVIIFGGIRVLNGDASIGVVVSFALFVQRFFEPVRELVMQYTQLQRAMAGGQRIFEVLDTKPEITDRPNAPKLPPIRGEITFENVSFSYVSGVPVLHDINLRVAPGETIALVGPTGSGKTTLTALIGRMYDVTSGSIRIDGLDIRQVQRTSLARQMGVVLQDPFLFSGTVRDNIRYGRPEATDQEIVRAAEAVGVHQFILQLEDGYDTILHERGQNLSLGQRQLLSFARAILADPRILILDEATANVDSTTEATIQRALKRLLIGRTSFVIAHRLSTIRGADRIVVLEGGQIVETGTHDELLTREGLYSRLYRMTYESRDGVAASGNGNGQQPFPISASSSLPPVTNDPGNPTIATQ